MSYMATLSVLKKTATQADELHGNSYSVLKKTATQADELPGNS